MRLSWLRKYPASSRRTTYSEPDMDPDDTLVLLFMCCHPSLSPASAIALTLRAVGGLTTGGDRESISRARGDDGAADQPGEAEHQGVRVCPFACRTPRSARSG